MAPGFCIEVLERRDPLYGDEKDWEENWIKGKIENSVLFVLSLKYLLDVT